MCRSRKIAHELCRLFYRRSMFSPPRRTVHINFFPAMIISVFRKTLPLLVSLLLTPVLFAQKSEYQVTRCGAVNRSAPVRNVFVDSDNARWVASGSGVSRVQASDLGTPVALNAGELTAYMFPGGNADVRWTPDILQMVLGVSPKITAAYYDSARDWLWLGTEDKGLFQLSTKPALKLVAKFAANNTKLKTNAITTIFKDKSGRYWIGTDEGMLVGTPDKWKVELQGYDVQRVRELGNDIYVLADGEFWLAQGGERWQAINVKEKALEGEAQDFDLDLDGNLWILSRMVSRYSLLTDEFEIFSGAVAGNFTSKYTYTANSSRRILYASFFLPQLSSLIISPPLSVTSARTLSKTVSRFASKSG